MYSKRCTLNVYAPTSAGRPLSLHWQTRRGSSDQSYRDSYPQYCSCQCIRQLHIRKWRKTQTQPSQAKDWRWRESTIIFKTEYICRFRARGAPVAYGADGTGTCVKSSHACCWMELPLLTCVRQNDEQEQSVRETLHIQPCNAQTKNVISRPRIGPPPPLLTVKL